MDRITLPGGGWADLHDKPSVRGRRGIQAISIGLGKPLIDRLKGVDPTTDLSELGLTEAQADGMIRLGEATVVAFLAAWSLDAPLPTLSTIGDVDPDVFDALAGATAARGSAVALSLDVSPGDGTPDPKDLSGSSEPSNGPSTVSAEPSQTLS